MNDTGIPLQTSYFDLLDGNITGSLYDTVPASPSYPYTQIDDRTMTDYTDKSNLGQEVTQTVWVVDRFAESVGSRSDLYTITDEILGIIRARPNPFNLTGFNVITSTLDLANFSRERTETHTYFRMEIRFRHLIEQLNP
ncbi:hypothetical protein [Gracilimonas sp.]|uniref:hypothetical protein n=1 Tax=Gracilimonas sp. TaxID=1974203 RepID=UPI002870BDC1|nr:hypothetical protein [Gracilimonas sp.]